MKLGFVSAILPDLSLDAVLGHAARLGFECVEVMCWPVGKADRRYSGITHLDVADFSAAKAANVHELCRKHGVSISGLGYYPNPLTPNESEAKVAVEQLQRIIEAAALLGIPRVNTFVGRDWTKSVDDNWPRFLATWKPLTAAADQHGVKIGIENCPMLFSKDEWPAGKNLAHSPAIWRRMYADIPSPNFGLNFDPSHLVWQQMDYLRPMREFKDRIFHVHAKDVRVDRHQLDEVGVLAYPPEYHTPKLPGMGDVDWGKFFSVLTDNGYDGAVCVEVEDRAFENTLAARLTSLKQSHDYLRGFLPREEKEP